MFAYLKTELSFDGVLLGVDGAVLGVDGAVLGVDGVGRGRKLD